MTICKKTKTSIKRGYKLRFLRIYWGFKTIKMLIDDPRWKEKMGTKFCREDNFGKYERGERSLDNNDLAGIASAFYIPPKIFSDSTSIEAFEKYARMEYEHHKKYAKNFGLTREYDPIISKTELLEKLALYSGGWEASDYLYTIPENQGKIFKPYTILDKSFWGDSLSQIERSFLLAVAIHYDAGWQQWTLYNVGNQVAVTAMFKILQITYLRPRLRALYAMQHLDMDELIVKELEKNYTKCLKKKIYQALMEHLPGKTMTVFIRKIAEDKNSHAARKASQVLSEIASYWNDTQTGISSPL